MRLEPALVVLSLVTAFARVTIASSSARLVYVRAPDVSTCPDEAELRRAVSARFGYDPFFPWAARTVVLQVWRAEGRYRSRLQVVDEKGMAHGVRELSSDQPTCSELFDASALAISIALDAAAKADAPERSQETPSPPPEPLPLPTAAPQLTTHQEERGTPHSPAPDSVRPRGFVRLSARFAPYGEAPAVTGGLLVGGGLRVGRFSAALEARVDLPVATTITETPTTEPRSVSGWSYAADVVPCLHLGPTALCAIGSLGQLLVTRAGDNQSALLLRAGGRVAAELALSSTWGVEANVDVLAGRSITYVFDMEPKPVSVSGPPPVSGAVGVGVIAHLR
jgi:hypothetical protein